MPIGAQTVQCAGMGAGVGTAQAERRDSATAWWLVTRGVLACSTGAALSSPGLMAVIMAALECKRLQFYPASG